MSFLAGQTYYIRARHRSLNSKVSAWSPQVQFTTISTPDELILVPNDAGQGYLAPTDIAIDANENYMQVSAGRAPYVDVNSGTTFFYRKIDNVWTYTEHIPPPVGTGHRGTNFQYGFAVAMAGTATHGILGGPGNAQGIIYLQVLSAGTNWSNITNNRATGYASGNQLGYAVALSNDAGGLFAGAPVATQGATASGAVSVWTRSVNSLTHRFKIQSNEPSASGRFGHAISCNYTGGILAVSQLYDDTGQTNSGAVFIYQIAADFTSATFRFKIKPSDIEANAEFGSRLALNKHSNASIDGKTLVVGCQMKDDTLSNTGAAYVFFQNSLTDWVQQAKLTLPDAIAGANFGWSVAISSDGNRIAVGAPGYNSNRGIVHVYDRDGGNNWNHTFALQASVPANNMYFGYALAMSPNGHRVYVGAPGRADGGSSNKGAVYMYTLNN